MDQLTNYVRQYRDLDNDLNAINKSAHEKRQELKDVEQNMGKILVAFPDIAKINLDKNSYILVKHPMAHNKSWGMSKRDLKELLDKHGVSNEIYEKIVEEQSKKLISNTFSFNRVVKE